ncbi:globin domain-containing protein [Streptomyces sp. NPDC046900]|uniref:globin domain-containing protein n=1 Tax=Streptomyces sp. NPDC046900 TaxID=3155473 RepID=UPI0033C6B7CE
MLSTQALPVVRATAPVVGANISAISELFYQRLFEAHPELLRDLFNRGNQANGSQRDALAGAVAAFASVLVERPDERPDAILGRIANKHASLGITSDQYTIVARHLLGAIPDVLGEAVTPEVAAAWDEVYWLMANALIAMEARLYAQASVADGDVWRRMEIVEREEVSEDAASFVLRRTDDTPAPSFRPGQYVSVQVELPDGARQIRQYSLSAAPSRKDWRITVKRERSLDGVRPEGEVSTWLHTHARAGDVLDVSLPFGDLIFPDADTPLLLASAGIGVTPMLSMLDHLANTGSQRRVIVVHADRSPATHAHRYEHVDLVNRLAGGSMHLWYESGADAHPAPQAAHGRADLSDFVVPEGTTAYLCGPLPFMQSVRGHLIDNGLPAASVHYEVFGPDLWLSRQ